MAEPEAEVHIGPVAAGRRRRAWPRWRSPRGELGHRKRTRHAQPYRVGGPSHGLELCTNASPAGSVLAAAPADRTQDGSSPGVATPLDEAFAVLAALASTTTDASPGPKPAGYGFGEWGCRRRSTTRGSAPSRGGTSPPAGVERSSHSRPPSPRRRGGSCRVPDPSRADPHSLDALGRSGRTAAKQPRRRSRYPVCDSDRGAMNAFLDGDQNLRRAV